MPAVGILERPRDHKPVWLSARVIKGTPPLSFAEKIPGSVALLAG